MSAFGGKADVEQSCASLARCVLDNSVTANIFAACSSLHACPLAHPLATARKPRTWHRKVAFSRTGRRDGSRQASKCGLPIGPPLPPSRLWRESARRPHNEHALGEVE